MTRKLLKKVDVLFVIIIRMIYAMRHYALLFVRLRSSKLTPPPSLPPLYIWLVHHKFGEDVCICRERKSLGRN